MAQKTGLLPYKSPYGNGFSTSERFGAAAAPGYFAALDCFLWDERFLPGPKVRCFSASSS